MVVGGVGDFGAQRLVCGLVGVVLRSDFFFQLYDEFFCCRSFQVICLLCDVKIGRSRSVSLGVCRRERESITFIVCGCVR